MQRDDERIHPAHDLWPPTRLRVTTPRLELRLPTDAEIATLCEAAIAGIHAPEQMPFAMPWTDQEPDVFRRSFYQHDARCRASWSPNKWVLHLAVFVDGAPVGSQDIIATDFGMLREVTTASWLARTHHGRGLGREMRQAALHFAFAGLGALSATSTADSENGPSNGVSRSCGYEEDGIEFVVRSRGPLAPGGISSVRAKTIRWRIDHGVWLDHARDDITITGLDFELRALCGVDRD